VAEIVCQRLIGMLAAVAVALFVAACGGGGSHQNSLGGKILIADQPLKNSTLSLGSTKKKAGPDTKTKTDAAGKYSFENVSAGSYMLTFGFRLSNGSCVIIDTVTVKEHGDQTNDIAIAASDLKTGLGLSGGGAIIKCQ
jgi:hypothetical protein